MLISTLSRCVLTAGAPPRNRPGRPHGKRLPLFGRHFPGPDGKTDGPSGNWDSMDTILRPRHHPRTGPFIWKGNPRQRRLYDKTSAIGRHRRQLLLRRLYLNVQTRKRPPVSPDHRAHRQRNRAPYLGTIYADSHSTTSGEPPSCSVNPERHGHIWRAQTDMFLARKRGSAPEA